MEWRKKDLKDLVHLYKNGGSQAEEQDEDHQDRAHLFTDQIQQGNFSLRLDKLTTEDEGEYTCTHTVLSGHTLNYIHGCRQVIKNFMQISTKINVVLRLLGKSTDNKTTHSSLLNQ